MFRDGKPRHADGAYEFIFDHADVQWRMRVSNPGASVSVVDVRTKEIDRDFIDGEGLSDEGLNSILSLLILNGH